MLYIYCCNVYSIVKSVHNIKNKTIEFNFNIYLSLIKY